MHLARSLLCLCGLFLAAGAGCSADSRDRTVGVLADDPDMTAAMQTARSQLPVFYKAFDEPKKGVGDFALKVKISDTSGTEYFWVGNLKKTDGKLYGTVDNTPQQVRTVKLKQRIEIPEQDIADWMFRRNSKIVGNYTMRAMFRDMDADEVAKYKSLLEEP